MAAKTAQVPARHLAAEFPGIEFRHPQAGLGAGEFGQPEQIWLQREKMKILDGLEPCKDIGQAQGKCDLREL
ncbi:MAG: hypothetical protein OEN02_07490 [Gammaproteobacteria bacterium]|nr:hypothetical protein [Gammaproteobacteria bacterium]MDH3536189.1 hypothetical protein [Gammaproteobacteria bacterium]